MKTRDLIKAFLLLIFLPYIVWLIIKNNKLKSILALFLLLTLLFGCFKRNKVQSLHIVDVQAAFNKNVTRNKTEWIVIHHTAGENAKPLSIAQIHLTERKWESVGYHYFIDDKGVIYNLRNDNEAQMPHAIGFNDNCVAICISGNFSEHECPELLWEIALELTRQMMKKYNIDTEHVIGHRELPNQLNTQCPGLKFDMNKFREDL